MWGWGGECACVRVCLRACVRACVRVCVCVREREREIAKEGQPNHAELQKRSLTGCGPCCLSWNLGKREADIVAEMKSLPQRQLTDNRNCP